MPRRTKPGEPPDMRTLDDPEPTAIPEQEPAWMREAYGPYDYIERKPEPRWKVTAMRMPPPTAWYRFWTWALLGWTWERIK